jgi:hypothetical protein
MSVNAIGSLLVVIGGDTTGLIDALDKADKGLLSTERTVRGTINSVGKLAIAAAAAGAAIAAGLVAKTMDAIDAHAKLARQLRATNEGLAVTQRAASLAGIEEEKMTVALRKLDVAIGEALQGSKAQADAFKAMGLSASELSKMDVDERIATINAALLANVPAAERAAVAGELWGKKVAAAIAAISPEDMAAAREEVEALGLAVSEVDSTTIERAGDALSVVGEVAKGAMNRVTVALGPMLDDVGQSIRQTAIETRGFEDQIDAAVGVAVVAAGLIADAWHGLKVIFKAITFAVAETAAGWLDMFTKIPEGIAAIIDHALSIINGYIRAVNKIPGVDIPQILFRGHHKGPGIMRDLADSVRQTATDIKADLHNMAMEPLPSEKLRQWVQDVKAAADEVSRVAVGGGGEDDGPASKGKIDDALKKRLDALRESLRTEEEAERVSHATRLADLVKAHEQRLISITEFNDLKAREEARHEEVMRGFQEARDAQWKKAEEQRAAELENLRVSLLTEEKIQWEHYQRQLTLLGEASEEELRMLGGFAKAKEDLKKKHEEKLIQIEDEAAKKRFGISQVHRKLDMESAKTFLGYMSQLMNTNSKKMFAIGKAAAIAETVINTYKAAMGAYAALSSIPIVGPALGIAAAAAAVAAGMANIQKIRSSEIGGGGGGAVPTYPANPTTGIPTNQPGGQVGGGGGGNGGGGGGSDRVVNVSITGSMFTRDQMVEVLEGLNGLLADGGKLRITS